MLHVTTALPTGARALYVHGPKPEFEGDDDVCDKFYIPCRILPLLRPGLDVAVLPEHPEVRLFAKFVATMLQLESWQIVFASAGEYLVERNVLNCARSLSQVREHVRAGNTWRLMSYSFHESVMHLRDALGENCDVFGDTFDWITKFGSKMILHPNADPRKRPAGVPCIADHVRGIRVPRGYVAVDADELLLASRCLKENGVEALIVKPVHGATGEGIIKNPSQEMLVSYQFPLGPVALEELLPIDRVGKADCVPSIQYCGQSVGLPTDQLVHGVAFAGNSSPSTVPSTFQTEFCDMARRLVAWMRPEGPGGFDALSVGGIPYIVDVNAGRWTGAHPAHFFCGLHAPGNAFATEKVMPTRPVFEFWHKLERCGIAFAPGLTCRGVFPLCFLPGMWGMLIAVAPTVQEAHVLLHRAKQFA